MTSLPMPPGLPDSPPSGFVPHPATLCEGIEADYPTVSPAASDEQHLLRAFRTFAETAGSLEHSYSLLRAEVARLRRELEESHAGLARSLEQNRSMRQHLDRILESLPCGVVVVSSGGEITHWNPEAQRLLALEEISNHSPEARRLLSDLSSELHHLFDAARAGSREREQQISAASGRDRWLAVRRANLAEDDGASSVFILQDISERKRMEQQQARHRREQALAEISAVLAHEVRNPLGSLELFASLLAEANLGAECREWVGHLQHGLRTLGATVNNVLHFHGAPPPERTPIDLGQLLDWAGSFLAPLARRAAVKVIVRNALRGVVFAGDRHQLEQVLLNLSLNALRVMPDGGTLELAGETEQNQDATDGSTFATLTISDTGPGIAPENLAQIFKAGFSTRAGSPGLGLAVCSKIVHQHGGAIAGAVRAEAGATFTVRFPLDETFRRSEQERAS
jgi:two-component system, sensor histidine kinase FlrB